MLPTNRMGHGDPRRAIGEAEPPAAGPRPDRRPGPVLSRKPHRLRPAQGGRRHAGLQLHPAPGRGAARRCPRPRPHGQGRGGGVPAHGRRLRRQGDPAVAVRLRRRAAGQRHRPAGQDAPRPRRRHDHDRQAAPPAARLRRRLRRRRDDRRHRADLRLALRHVGGPVGAGQRPHHVPLRQRLLPARGRHHLAPVQDQHRLQHRLSRLWRPAGHDGHRVRGGRDRPLSGGRPARRAQAEFLRHRRAQHRRPTAWRSRTTSCPRSCPSWSRARTTAPGGARSTSTTGTASTSSAAWR